MQIHVTFTSPLRRKKKENVNVTKINWEKKLARKPENSGFEFGTPNKIQIESHWACTSEQPSSENKGQPSVHLS